MDVGQNPKGVGKERLLAMLGIFVLFAAIPLSFMAHIAVGDIAYILGLILTVYFTAQLYKKENFSQQGALSKFAIIKNSVGKFIFILIITIVMLVVNFMLL